MNCVRKSATAFILVNIFLNITNFYNVTCAAFNNTFLAVLIKKSIQWEIALWWFVGKGFGSARGLF